MLQWYNKKYPKLGTFVKRTKLSVKGEPGTRPTSVQIHVIAYALKAATAEGINTAYTAVLKSVLLC